jgi:hypothetical protein
LEANELGKLKLVAPPATASVVLALASTKPVDPEGNPLTVPPNV